MKKYPRFSFNFKPEFLNTKEMSEYISQTLDMFRQTLSLKPAFVIESGKNKKHKVDSFHDSIISKNEYLNLYIHSSNEEYEISTIFHGSPQNGLNIVFYFFSPFLEEQLSNNEIKSFFENQIQLLPKVHYAYANDMNPYFQLVHNLYEPFDFAGRDSFFTGFRWLNYLGPEEMALNGGKALYDLSYLTKAEPLGEGIFIQVGETPNDARTEQGKQQLFKATEAWWEMIQKKGG